MKKSKNQIVIATSVLVLVTLILLGFTYAYYKTRINGNTKDKSISVVSKKLEITYADGNGEITSNDFEPGSKITKTFSVKNTGDEEIYYSIALEDVINTFTRIEDIKYTLKKGEETIGTGHLPSVDKTIAFKEKINKNETNEYSLIVEYLNLDEDQSIDMGSTLSLLVQIKDSEEVIEINNAEQLKALSRIMTYNEIRDASKYNIVDDAKQLQSDITLTTKDDIINYFINKTYSLNNDIDITYNTEFGPDYFNGIGCMKYKFGGNIYGNGHTLNLSYDNYNYKSIFLATGFINYLTDAGIYDLNIVLKNSFVINNVTNYTSKLQLYSGILVGNAYNSTFENITINLNNTDFKVDFSNEQNNMYVVEMGLLAGTSNGVSKINNINLNINNSEILVDLTTSQRSDGYKNDIGLLAGSIVNSTTTPDKERCYVNNIKVNFINSNLTLNAPDNENSFVGGLIGHNFTALLYLSNSKLYSKNSKIKLFTNNSGYLTAFAPIAVGGILGGANSGTDNVTENTLKRKGTIIENVSYISINDTKMDAIVGSENEGGAINVGGIVGFAYNNLELNNCNVELNNANIIGERLKENSTPASLGVHVGGIIGRFEHTGIVENSTVTSNNSNIIANATENNNYVGGITGFAFNPVNIDLDSLTNNKFYGNNSTNIELNIISGNNSNKQSFVGALAGRAYYVISDNQVFDTKVKISGIKDAITKSTVGISNYIGNYIETNGTVNFDIRTPEIKNAKIENITLDTSGLDNYITIKKY